jgi:hypothetical protein
MGLWCEEGRIPDMLSVGFTELVIVLFALFIYAIPVIAAIWIIFTLRRICYDTDAIRSKLEAIEQSLQRNSPG